MGSTLISNGTVVNADSAIRADVLVRDGRIVALGIGSDWTADHVIDATGKLVIPGGIDAHTHLEYPIDGFTTRTADDFYTGTVAAAHGGTTTILDFVKKEPGRSLYDTYLRRRDAAAERSVVDFGLHAIVPPRDQQPDVLDDLRRLAAGEGAASWKFFMAYPGTQMVDDGELLEGFERALEYGVLPMVHAENGHMVARETQRLVDSGQTAEHFHATAHGHDSEAEAVHRAIVLADSVGAPLYVVHVSSAAAAEEISRARADGRRVWGETCPQYLQIAYEDYAGLGEKAAAYLCSPPIRERSNQEGLWKTLATGAMATVATDHAGFCLHQPDDLPPQKLRSPGYFPKVPNGVPGIEDRLMVLWEGGVASGRIDPCRFVDLVSTRPAKLFGLYPRKGVVAVGADADLVVWDPQADHVITTAGTHMRTDYNLYDGLRVAGKPVNVLSRGDHLVDASGSFDGAAGRGSFVDRGKPYLC